MAYVHYEVRKKAGVLTFNRPEALNVLSRAALEDVSRLLQNLASAVERSDAVGGAPRALILTGAGRAFIAGANINDMRFMDSAAARAFSRLGNQLLRQVETFPLPVIAAVNGFALGGGLEMALSADFIYAARTAKFGLPEVTLGLIPGFGGTKRLLQRIGNARARELILTGRIVDAEEAFRIGLVNRVVEPDALMETALAVVDEIAQAGPHAVREAKILLDACAETVWDNGIEREAERFGALFAHSESAEGMLAFIEKRTPSWVSGSESAPSAQRS